LMRVSLSSIVIRVTKAHPLPRVVLTAIST
jgi:hypothetical protein